MQQSQAKTSFRHLLHSFAPHPFFYLCQADLHQIDVMIRSLMLLIRWFFRFRSPLILSLGKVHYLFITFLMAYVFFLSEVFQYSINLYILQILSLQKTTAPIPNCCTVLTGKKSSVKNTSSQFIHSLIHLFIKFDYEACSEDNWNINSKCQKPFFVLETTLNFIRTSLLVFVVFVCF